jgi:hypothetical protein
VEGLTTPWSNKRTASLPNPCPVGLQSHCSILPGSLPLGMCQATALCQTHTWWDTRPSTALSSTPQTHITPEYLPLGHAAGPTTTGIPSSQSAKDPSLEPVPQLTRLPAPPPESTAFQTLLSPSHTWDDQNPLLPSGPAWLQLHVEWLEPCQAGTGTILVWDSHTRQPARNPAPCAELFPALKASQITAPPGSCWGFH